MLHYSSLIIDNSIDASDDGFRIRIIRIIINASHIPSCLSNKFHRVYDITACIDIFQRHSNQLNVTTEAHY